MLAKSCYSIKRKRFKICYLNISCHTTNMRETGFLVYIRFVDLSSIIVSKDLFHLQGERLNYSSRTRLTVERKKWEDELTSPPPRWQTNQMDMLRMMDTAEINAGHYWDWWSLVRAVCLVVGQVGWMILTEIKDDGTKTVNRFDPHNFDCNYLDTL